LTIDDSGPGIPEKLRLKVFEPFYSHHHNADPHLGIGLSRVQQVIVRHGGFIDILDAPEGGCRIIIELPAAGDDR